MTSLKQLALYCRDYIDLVSPSLLSRQAKKITISQDILDATPLYTNVEGIDYESLTLPLNLELSLEELNPTDDTDTPPEETEGNSRVDDEKLEIARTLDDIYRKYETSSYTKQVSLKFGRIEFSAKSLDENEDTDDDESGDQEQRSKKVEQHLFSVPVTISFRDFGGFRHYSLTIDDSQINTNISFLNEFLTADQRNELFRFISTSESSGLTSIPLQASYVDELWTKIVHFLTQSDATDISHQPDMENVMVILLPKVNYFLSQDLLGIIDAAEDDELLETSLSAWVSDTDMSISEETDDSGERELYFPFPYDDSQLHVLGKLGNRAAVVEGPPGTGKSQTIANILCHLAATGNKVLFVSQKDQAVRGVKDKLKSLDIPYLYGYLPDRSSRLHTEEDERDSAANALKGIAQAFYTQTTAPSPTQALKKVSELKPTFIDSLEDQRIYFELHSEWAKLDEFEFGNNAPIITRAWVEDITNHKKEIASLQANLSGTEERIAKLSENMSASEQEQKDHLEEAASLTTRFHADTGYEWLLNEEELLRRLTYKEVGEMVGAVIDKFDEHAPDRKTNFLKSTLNNMRLNKELNSSIEALPREMYETIRGIVFSDKTKTDRYSQLKTVHDYFTRKSQLINRASELGAELKKIAENLDHSENERSHCEQAIKEHNSALRALLLDEVDMQRVGKLIQSHGIACLGSIARRHELSTLLEREKSINPNKIHDFILNEKSNYRSLIRTYLKNILANNIEHFRQERKYRAAIESIGRKLSKTKKAYKTFDSLKSDPMNFDAMSGIIPIWMMGLDDASRVLPLAHNIFDYVIIDEASQCNISYALPVMYRSKHTILFGDTLQMRDTTTAFKSNDRLQAIADKHSIPEDLQIKATEDSVKSVMDIAKLAGFPTSVLRNHYRSPMELIGFSNKWFYEPRGRRLQVINDDLLVMDDGRVLKNHVIEVDMNSEVSEKTNLSEAVYIKNLIRTINKNPQTQDKSIAVLTFFNEQAELLRRVITDENIKISVIEGIQGDERDIVIYSFVIKSPAEKKRYIALTGESGEIRKEVNEGRVNVAFSRARLQVHAVTSIPPHLWPDGIWIKRYLEYVEKHGRVERLSKHEQHFDSKFEENVFDFLSNKLSPADYLLSTQVESCGFKIDQVISNTHTGKKLAIECDGPTHFEFGDGQVRVANDYERQYVLETAGWRFYRINYSDWQKDEATSKRDLLQCIEEYMNQKTNAPDGAVHETETPPEYRVEKVEVSDDLVATLKANPVESQRSRFGRPAKSDPKPQHDTLPLFSSESSTAADENAGKVKDKETSKQTPFWGPEPRYEEFSHLQLTPKKSVTFYTTDNGLVKIEAFRLVSGSERSTGSILLKSDEIDQFVEAVDGAIRSEDFLQEVRVPGFYEQHTGKPPLVKLLVRCRDSDTVEIGYTDITKPDDEFMAQIRVVKTSAKKMCDELRNVRASLENNTVTE